MRNPGHPIYEILRDIGDLPGPYSQDDPELLMVRRDELEAILENRLCGAPSIDKHPLRYSKLSRQIEQILSRRCIENRLDGHALEASIEIAEKIVGTQPADQR